MTNVGILNDQRFYGDYHEIHDIFSSLSPVSGQIYRDRSPGYHTRFAQILQANIYSNNTNLSYLLSIANIKYIIIRLNMAGYNQPSMEEQSYKLEKKENLRKIYNTKTVAVFENTKVLPHIYPAINSLFNINSKVVNITTYNGRENSINWKYLTNDSIEARFYDGGKSVIRTDGKEPDDTLNSTTDWVAFDSTLIFMKAGSEPLIIEKIIEQGKPIKDIVGIWTDSGSVSSTYPIFIPSKHRAIIQINHKTINTTVVLLNYEYNLSNIKLENSPTITFQKINPTRYIVRVDNAVQPFSLVFSESYHTQWKAYVESAPFEFNDIIAEYNNTGVKEAQKEMKFTPSDISYLLKKPITEDKHSLINGYANAWYIDPKDVGKENFTVTIYYEPQSYLYLGFIIAGFTIIGCLLYISYKWKEQLSKK